MADENHPAHLSPSELGTKNYWETYYARTLAHLSSKHQPNARPTPTADADADSAESESETESVDDDDDPGTSWFSEHNAPEKVLRFLTDESFPLAPCNTLPATSTAKTAAKKPQSDEERGRQPSILDLGTGNGSMLALLRKRGGFRGVMVGVDYSARSVELARELQRLKIHSAYLSGSESEGEEQEEGEEEDVVVSNGAETAEASPVPEEDKDMMIRFEEWDILNSEGQLEGEGRLDWFPYAQGGFDIVLDKGTFDAVSLSEEVVVEGKSEGKVIQRRVCERYPSIARRLVRKGGFLVVTSCNWTEEELVRWFTGEEAKGPGADRLEVWGRVEYPKFRFGGQEGQGVCTGHNIFGPFLTLAKARTHRHGIYEAGMRSRNPRIFIAFQVGRLHLEIRALVQKPKKLEDGGVLAGEGKKPRSDIEKFEAIRRNGGGRSGHGKES
ncbi:hypothetical protein KXV79_005191 [Aspergillus fumigatus]|nr:hypothetical protein KXX48_006884 [Aspergillus fumigatus]KAH1763292.1 hypothetical protein KXX56_008743 [Aspergillus fumigatus]KAH1904865.1 hypothetical protein KXW04_006604 [Aspergillus fumigatus]KAH1979991.1 hypothetical protein KXX04_004596 [Aspergillus fumigatus]KAH2127630.1 hypothetical protein KXW66_000949 [Aspergillus fumigatus]